MFGQPFGQPTLLLTLVLMFGLSILFLWVAVTVIRYAWKGGSTAMEARLGTLEDEVVELKVQLRVLGRQVRALEDRNTNFR